MRVFMTRLFQDLCDNCARSSAFVCPFLHHVEHDFVIISTNFFRPFFEVGGGLVSESRGGHIKVGVFLDPFKGEHTEILQKNTNK